MGRSGVRLFSVKINMKLHAQVLGFQVVTCASVFERKREWQRLPATAMVSLRTCAGIP